MKIAEYAEKSRSVALYHDKSPMANFTYPALGLAGEVGELIDKMTDMPEGAFPHAETAVAIIKEAGDVLWYINNTALDMGLELTDPIDDLTLDIPRDLFEYLPVLVDRSDDHRPIAHRMSIHAGRVAEVAKKMIRDTSGEMPVEKRTVVYASLCELLIGLCDVCDGLNITMDDVASGNIDKLFSRRDRGTLSGSGDNR
jgi:NTP pyrophosphatase (non-canonical NTP hydrolase)